MENLHVDQVVEYKSTSPNAWLTQRILDLHPEEGYVTLHQKGRLPLSSIRLMESPSEGAEPIPIDMGDGEIVLHASAGGEGRAAAILYAQAVRSEVLRIEGLDSRPTLLHFWT